MLFQQLVNKMCLQQVCSKLVNKFSDETLLFEIYTAFVARQIVQSGKQDKTFTYPS
jgi:hypothetical protein